MGVLRTKHRFRIRERREGLVALSGKEQALKIAADRVALIASSEERVKALHVGFEGFSGR